MKQGKSLQELAAAIEQQAAAKKDYVADTSVVSVSSDDTMHVEGVAGQMAINPLAHRQIAERLQIPAKFYDRVREEYPRLWSDNVNTLMRGKPERRLIRTLDGKVRAFLSDRYQRLDYHDIASTVLPVLAEIPGIRTVSTEITESRMYIKAVTTEIQAEVKSRRVGDVVQAGVIISGSEVGLGATVVKPFALQLVCLNGMVRDKGFLRAVHLGRRIEGEDVAELLADDTKQVEDRAILLKVRDVVKAAFDEAKFRAWIDRMNGAVEQPIEGDVPKVVELAGEAFGLLESERASVLRHLIQGADLSAYGLMNAITRTAEDVESYDRATELETIGPAVIDLPASDWQRISQAR